MELSKENMVILEELKRAIKKVYDCSEGYFNTTKGRERSIVFRIAHHLANQVEGEGLFVDIEATRCNDIIKRLETTKTDSRGKRIIPDLIIHKRQRTGYLVAEFKCSTNNWQHDENKLKDLTSKNHYPHYKLGAFVYLDNTLDKVEITLFQNGVEYETIRGL